MNTHLEHVEELGRGDEAEAAKVAAGERSTHGLGAVDVGEADDELEEGDLIEGRRRRRRERTRYV